MTADGFRDELRTAFARSDALFSLLPDEHLLARPIGLRHPFLFYVGHLPAFAYNQVGAGILGQGPLHPTFDRLFERGIDPAGEAEANNSSPRWPALAEVLDYRDRARAAVLDLVPDVLERDGDPLCAQGRILRLVVEHERMHHETLMYMLAECPAGWARAPEGQAEPQSGEGMRPQPLRVGAGTACLGADFEAIPFGWDNEFGLTPVAVEAFSLDSAPVRNSDWLEFLRTVGEPTALWPQNWALSGGEPAIKTVFGLVPFEVAEGWPVQVSGTQARVYCAAKGGRLPTEAELWHAAHGQPDGGCRRYPWGEHAPGPQHGNFGFRHFHPVPTGSHPAGASAWGVHELVGNGWEWSSTPFAPLPSFCAYARTYPGYSADFFDGDHDVVLGASWATDPCFLRPSFRNWYRRGYPFATTKFRVVYPD